jgi:exodeoxyribonuclease-5
LQVVGILMPDSSCTLIQAVNDYALNYFTSGGVLLNPSLPAVCFDELSTTTTLPPISPQIYQEIIPFSLEIIPPAISAAVEPRRTLSKDQIEAWDKLRTWVYNQEPFFVLRGFAGTGKTFLLQLLNELKVRVYYSAPTNKAAKVVGSAIGDIAKTTYSMLGLRMEQIEDKLVLVSAGVPPYFPKNAILVVDEASMVGTELYKAICSAREKCNIKILLVGDPMQLPPVGESRSPAWSSASNKECKAMLKQVMRYDNQLLVLATELRRCIKDKDWWSPLVSDHTDTGVWKYKNEDQFRRSILKAIDELDDIKLLTNNKVIAWRNKTVDGYNKMIRKHLGFKEEYCVGDILLLAEPIEEDGTLLAHTDDEFRVTSVGHSVIAVDDKEIEVWSLQVQGDKQFTLSIAEDPYEVDFILSQKAAFAKKQKEPFRKSAWKDFWRTKAKFNKVRYGYALTAHRAQGSTYTNCWIDQMDILCNTNKKEAFRCLYVAATRATTNLYSF